MAKSVIVRGCEKFILTNFFPDKKELKIYRHLGPDKIADFLDTIDYNDDIATKLKLANTNWDKNIDQRLCILGETLKVLSFEEKYTFDEFSEIYDALLCLRITITDLKVEINDDKCENLMDLRILHSIVDIFNKCYSK